MELRWAPEALTKLNELPDYLTLRQIENTGLVSAKTLRHDIADPACPLTAIKVGVRRAGTTRDNRPVRIAKAELIRCYLQPLGSVA